MATTYGIKDWDEDADQNTGASPLGAPEGMPRTTVNNVMREMMGVVRQDWDGSAAAGGGSWRNPNGSAVVAFASTSSVTIAGFDATVFFPAGRKIQIDYASGNSGYAFVTSSTFSTNTTVNLQDFDDTTPDHEVRNATMNGIYFYAGFGGDVNHEITSAAFGASGVAGAIETPSAFTDVALQAAIDTGKVVVLKAGTYALAAKVTIPAGTVILGVGGASILKADAGLDVNVLEFEAAADDCLLFGFTIDGNAANQASDSVGIAGNSSGAARVTLRDLYIHDTYSEGIKQLAGDDGWVISGVTITNTGHHGMVLESSVHQFVSDVRITGPGFGGEGTNASDGISCDSPVSISNVFIDMNGNNSNNGDGIDLLSAVPPFSSLTGFVIEGSVASGCDGLQISGPCAISGGHIDMGTGGDGSLLGESISVSGCSFNSDDELTVSGDRIVISGCTFTGASGLLLSNSDGGLITGCVFELIPGRAITYSGTNRATIRGCTFHNCDDESILVTGNNLLVENCVFTSNTDSAIRTSGTRSGLTVRGCTFDTITVDALLIAANCNDSQFYNNEFIAVSGSNINDSGARNSKGDVLIEGVAQAAIGTSEVIVTGMGNIPYPRIPDGSKRFIVECWITMTIDTSTTQVDLTIHSGTAGNLTDGNIASDTTTGVTAGDDKVFHVGPVIVSPSALSTLTVGIQTGTGASHDVRAHGTKSATTVLEAGRTYISVRALEA